MLQAIYENITEMLMDSEIYYEEIDHPSVRTTGDSAKYRAEAGWNEGVGSKNLVFHAKGEFYVVVTVAAKDIKARLFKKEFGTKDIRFATPEELSDRTGCLPGAVPPFGFVRPDIAIYVDKDIFEAPYFMFNPGIHTKSIRLVPGDLLEVYQSVGNPVKLFAAEGDRLVFEDVVKQAAPDPYKQKKPNPPEV